MERTAPSSSSSRRGRPRLDPDTDDVLGWSSNLILSQHLSKMYYGFWYKQPQLILLSIIANGTFIAPSNKKASRVNSYYKSAPSRHSAYNTCKRTYAIFYCPEQLDMLFDSCYVGNYYAYINNSSVEKIISFLCLNCDI